MATMGSTIEPLSWTVPRPVTSGVIIAIESNHGHAVLGETDKWCLSPWATGVKPSEATRPSIHVTRDESDF